MNSSMIILIVEMALVLLVVICVMGYLSWKQKKNRIAELEQLLENANDQQAERKVQLEQFLIKDYALEKNAAKESADYMVEAERQFLQQFIRQQLEQTKVTDFYANLSELLDQYLYFVPSISEQQETPGITKNIENKEGEEEKLIEENAFNAYGKANSKEDNVQLDELENAAEDSEPDWGDAFSESGDTMDDDVKEGYEAGLKDEQGSTEEEAEPDWGDAFSESGDTMDEDAKAGYDAGLNNEEVAEEDAEPDWGDAFAESGDTMDEDAKDGYDSELNKE